MADSAAQKHINLREACRRSRMDRLADQILQHEALHPDDFDGREELWMQRENLRRLDA